MDEGHITLSRRLFKNFLWEEQRSFSRAEAWIDCIQTARWKDGKQIVNGKLLTIPRGGLAGSIRYLSNRWQWSTKKVRIFLSLLESDGMIHKQKAQGETILILSKYESYNKEGPPKGTPRAQGGHTEGTPRAQIEEGEEGKESKPSCSDPLQWSELMGWQGVTDQDRADWSAAYPAVNIDRQIAASSQWLKANPSKAKKKLWRRFLTNWLARQQERGGDLPSNPRNGGSTLDAGGFDPNDM